jgi:hypothetical protein
MLLIAHVHVRQQVCLSLLRELLITLGTGKEVLLPASPWWSHCSVWLTSLHKGLRAIRHAGQPWGGGRLWVRQVFHLQAVVVEASG